MAVRCCSICHNRSTLKYVFTKTTVELRQMQIEHWNSAWVFIKKNANISTQSLIDIAPLVLFLSLRSENFWRRLCTHVCRAMAAADLYDTYATRRFLWRIALPETLPLVLRWRIDPRDWPRKRRAARDEPQRGTRDVHRSSSSTNPSARDRFTRVNTIPGVWLLIDETLKTVYWRFLVV